MDAADRLAFPWPGRACTCSAVLSGPGVVASSLVATAMAVASKTAVERGLKSVGFRRQGSHLHRTHDDLVHGVNFQASQWGTAAVGSFTINLVVTSPWLYSSWTSKPLPRNPATALFPVSHRIGAVMPSQRDHWWEVTSSTDMVALGAEVSEAIMMWGVPFLDGIPNGDALLDRIRSRKDLSGLIPGQVPLVHAILAVERGLGSEAGEQLRGALEHCGESPFSETIRRLSRQLGLEGEIE